MVCKTGKKDSAMAIDQAGEQGNKVIESVAGGLNTVHQQNDAFRTWSIAAPEIVRCVAEYELLTQTSDRSSAELLSHHEDNALEDAFDPFVPCTTRLCYINNGTPQMNAQEVAESVKTMRGRGVELKADFRKVRFDDRSMPLNAPIHHNKILLPSNPSNVNPKKQVVMSKAKDIDLTQKIKNAASVRADEALYVLQYEPMNVPPCLSTSTGEIYSGTKSTVLKPLRKLGAVAQFPLFSEVMSTLIIDLSFVVNLLGSVRAVTYGATVNRFLDTVWTYIEQLGTRYARIDIVTDRYNCVHLLKQRTRKSQSGCWHNHQSERRK